MFLKESSEKGLLGTGKNVIFYGKYKENHPALLAILH
jgi:hypothetical protein